MINKEDLQELCSRMSRKDVAGHLGVHHNTIKIWMAKLGVTPKRGTSKAFGMCHKKAREYFENEVPKPWFCAKCQIGIKYIGNNLGYGNVHHVDEDWTNNSPENLQLWCKTCHSKHHNPKTRNQK